VAEGFADSRGSACNVNGEADLDTLFAFCADKVDKRKIKNHSFGAFTPWTKMTQGIL
jgi:hypothetical protein